MLSLASAALTTRGDISFKQVHGYGATRTAKMPTRTRNTRRNAPKIELATFLLGIRGGGVGSVISNFNEYVGASKSRSWAILMVSILCDTASAALMKTAQTESSKWKLMLSFFGFFLSLSGFALSLKAIDVSVAYGVWSAVGTALVSVLGVALFGENLNATKVFCLLMIVLGVVGLELSDGH